MTPNRFREVLVNLNMRPVDLAAALDCDERLARRWASGRVPVPASLGSWLEDLVAVYERRPTPRPEWNRRPAREDAV